MGSTLHPVSLTDRYELLAGRVQLTGVQALARLVLDQIRRDRATGSNVAGFISGYEGSPLGGYDLELLRHKKLLEEHHLVLQPGLNEESGAMAVQGSQLAQTLDGQLYDGVFGVWYGKAPGLDRAKDALRHANLMGTAPSGGVLCLVGDDPAAKSSSVPCASEIALSDLRMPILYPADSQETLDLGLHGIEMSRATGLWTALKVVTAVADGSSTVHLDSERVKPLLPQDSGTHVPNGRLLQPTLGTIEVDQVTKRIRLAAEYGRLNELNRVVVGTPHDRLGIVAAGKTYLDLREALTILGLDDEQLEAHGIRLLKVAMPYPVHPETILDFARGLDLVVVVEEKRSFIEATFRDVLYDAPDRPVVVGKRAPDGSEMFAEHGELDADEVVRHLAPLLTQVPSVARWLAARAPIPFVGKQLPLLAKRAPYFCSGCPHNSSTKTTPDSLVGAGIGCHALVLVMDEQQVGTVVGLTQMGGEGTQWIGMSPFLERDHFVQNLGDGTFHHSGSLAIRAAVAAEVNMTFKVLYNSTVAMTGGQDAVGFMPVDRLVGSLLVEGVSRVIVTTEDLGRYRRQRMPRGVEVWDRSRLSEAQQVLAGVPGVTVLVHDQECATQQRRKRKRSGAAPPQTRIAINERICEGCGDCGRVSNCLSVHPVETEHGRKTRIHQSSCNSDHTCLQGDCPAFLVVKPGVRRAAEVSRLEADELPPPRSITRDDDFSVRLSGIGGTGVITVSAVLSTAALMSGRYVRTLDQTGLAQKGGAVVSDLKLSRHPVERSNRVVRGGCDLYLVADSLAAADETTLAVASPERTAAVVSTAQTPTGRMVSDVRAAVDTEEASVGRIAREVRSDASVFLDARDLAVRLFGDDQYANMVLVGVAFQTGALPIPADAIEAAIALNGAAVTVNVQAFRRGRQYVADRAALQALLRSAADKVEEPQTVEDLIAARSAELVRYQNLAYAQSYRDVVERVRLTETERVPGSTALTEAVARHLFKLMAYKDEYEVARLALDPGVAASLEEEFGVGATAAWKLHPPALRTMGLSRKLTLGPWFAGVFRVLCQLRHLRGTPFDPFGYARVRRVERQLIHQYRDMVGTCLEGLSTRTHATAVQLAELPDLIRGYEEIKLANVETYHAAVAELLEA